MKKIYWYVIAMTILSFTFTACGEDEEETENVSSEQQEDKNKDADGNVAKVIVEVGTVTDSDEETNYYEVESGTRVYMFKLSDWDISDELDLTEAAGIAITDDDGFATFAFNEEKYAETQNYVFAVLNEDEELVSTEVTIKKGKIAEILLFETGEYSGGAKFTNLVKTYELKPILTQAQYKLGIGMWFNDKSNIQVELPENTVEWYYKYSCHGIDGTEKLNLLGDLLNYFDKRAGLAANAFAKLQKPTGNETCTIKLLNEENYKKYSNGNDYLSFVTQNKTKCGLFYERKYTDPGTYYLAFKNENLTTRVMIELDIVAVVEIE